MSRVLVTGATGFVGAATLDALAAAGHEVHAAARRPPASAGATVWHAADLLDPDTPGDLVARVQPTHLLHLAWYAEPGAFWTAPENLDWVAATLRLARAFVAGGGRRIVGAGTCAEYDWGTAAALREDAPTAPANLYATSKHATASVLADFCAGAGLSFAWGRVFFLYGPHEDPRRLVASVARATLTGQAAPVSTGEQRRDFMHREDAARAFVALLDADAEGAVNVATGEGPRVADVVIAVASEAGREDLVAWGAIPARAGDPATVVADVTRLREEVGFRPRFSLGEGIADTVRWWRDELSDGVA